MSDGAAARNRTYRQLREPPRQGSYTVGQLVALAASGLFAVGIAGALLRLGAPVGLSLTAGVLLAGSIPMGALALEGREFNVPGFLRAAAHWQRAPRRYAPGAGAVTRAYYVRDARQPRRRGRRGAR